MNLFNEIEIQQQKKLASCMASCNETITLKPNQRIKEDKCTGIKWLEERRSFKNGGAWSRCWVRIAKIN